MWLFNQNIVTNIYAKQETNFFLYYFYLSLLFPTKSLQILLEGENER